MAPRKESAVWKDFIKIEDSQVKCKLCGAILIYKGGSTSTMLNHLKLVHKKMDVPVAPPGEKGQQNLASYGITPGRPCTPSRNAQINGLIAEMVAHCNLPFRFVEQESFRNLMAYIEPNYKPVCSETIKTIIMKQAEIIKCDINKKISDCSAVALTTDAWTSVSNDGYLSITASMINHEWEMLTPVLETVNLLERHTADYLASEILSVVKKWNISLKTIAIIHDNAANIAHVASKINPDWEDIGCAAHTLHLAVIDAMGMKNQVSNHVIARTVNAASRLVGHFSHSSLATQELNKKCCVMNPDEKDKSKKLIQYCRTRWNSISDMFDRLDELRWPVTAVLGDEKVTKPADAKSLDLKHDQWSLIKAINPVLKSIKNASTILCAEHNPSISIMLPALYGLVKKKLCANDDDDQVVATFKSELSANLVKRFNLDLPDVAISVAAIATILDPRHKKLSFFTEELKKLTYKKLQDLYEQAHSNESIEDRQPKTPRVEIEEDLFFDCDDNRKEDINEFDRYLVDVELDKNKCPLNWWKKNEDRFSCLSSIAKKYLCVPATSVASERHFSAAGRIISKSRSCLLPETSATLLFVSRNKSFSTAETHT